MTLSHDGHDVVCTACRTPLRVTLVSRWPVRLYHDQLHIDDTAVEHSECDNCGASLGGFETLQEQYRKLVSA